MFKHLFNSLFRRKAEVIDPPFAPSPRRRLNEAELEALRIFRADEARNFIVNRPPEFVKVRVTVIDESQHFDPKKITTFNHPAIADDSSQRGRGNNED